LYTSAVIHDGAFPVWRGDSAALVGWYAVSAARQSWHNTVNQNGPVFTGPLFSFKENLFLRR
jgi:hypothetical protein